MQRYFAKDKNLNLYDSDYHHIKNVMRMKKGEIIEVVYDDTLYICKLTSISNISSFDILEEKKLISKKVKIISAFALLKEQKLDYLLQKSTEVGIDYFIPLKTSRSIIKYDEKKDSKKIDRWKRIIKEASEQCFRSNMPIINDVISLKELVNFNADLKLLCTLNEKSENIKKILQNNTKCDTILIVTGPEGGFSKEEEELLIKNGFYSTLIGNNVLRSETAPIVCASIINYEFKR